MNRYSYVYNNPLAYNDPTGNWPSWADIGRAAQTVWNGLQVAATSTGKGIVQGSAAITGIATSVAQQERPHVQPVVNAVSAVPQFAVEHTIVPFLNATGAGVTGIDINLCPGLGYTELDVSGTGWIARALERATGGHPAITLPLGGTLGQTSLEIINSDAANFAALQRHEPVHVVQEAVLGPAFVPLYFLGNALYGYNQNPFELQADR